MRGAVLFPERQELQVEQDAVPSDTYPVLGEPLAIEFANTLFTDGGRDGGRPLDALTTPSALTRWLQTSAALIPALPPSGLGAFEVERARELRGTIRALLETAVTGGQPPVAAVGRLNEVAALAPTNTRLRWSASEPPKAYLPLSAADHDEAVLALLAQSAIEVLGGSDASRLRRCEAPGCINFYMRARPRRMWCSPTCGNRVRVARHYRRTHPTRS